MSVMLRCSCGNELTVPDEAATGLVNCPACHGKIDPKTSVIHPRLDDLEPDLLLAPDDESNATAPVAIQNSRPQSSAPPDEDDFLAMMDMGSSTNDSDDDLGLFSGGPASDSDNVPLLDDFGSTTPSSVGAAPSVRPPADDEEGYAVVETEYGAKSAEAPTWLEASTSDLSDELDDLAVAEENAANPAAQVAKNATKPALPESASNVRTPMDDLLDDEIMIAPEEKPPVPETPAECPECHAELKPGTILCVACGYNIKLGKKMDAAPVPEKGGKGKQKPTKEKTAASANGAATGGLKAKLKDPRVMIAVGGGGGVLLLAIIGYLMFGGGSESASVATPNAPADAPPTPPVPGSATPTAIPGENPDGTAATAAAADPTQPKLLLAPSGSTGRATSLAISADGKLLAAGSDSGNAMIWDLEKGESKPALAMGVSSPVQVSFDSAAKQLLTGFSGGAKLWDVAAGSETRSFKSPVDGLFAARFSADGNNLITSGSASILSIVDLGANGRTKSVKVELPPGAYPVVDVTPDGKTAVIGADDGLLAVCDLATGRPKFLEGHTTRIAAVAISPDGKRVISAAGGPEYRTIGKERFLTSSRPTDFTVRVWDTGSGRETYRWHSSPSAPVTCVAFADDGVQALVVSGDVQIIDVAKNELVTTIAAAQPGATQPPADPGVPIPPTEPFRLAVFSHDGNRVVTGSQSSGVHVWALPTNAEPKPLPGTANPPDLAAFKPADWAPIQPLLVPASAAPDDKEMAERLAISSKAAQVSASKNATIKALQKALATQSRTPENLIKMARLCAKKKLELEAEECLRAALMADPTSTEAKQLYQELKLIGPAGGGPISITRAWIKEIPDLEDAGLHPDPPKNTSIVSIPIEVAVVEKVTKVDASTLVGKAGDKEATFLGIHHRPTGEVTGAKRTPGGSAPPSGQLQVWESMQVGKDKTGKVIVQLQNRKIPQNEPTRGKQPASGTPKVKQVPDTSKVKENYKGPYEALFAVPEGETLSEIQWQETTPIRVLSEEPKSLDKLVLDSSEDKPQRLAAIEALGVSPTETAADTLEKVIASGDDDLFVAARAALRNVRRQANQIAPEYLPVPDEKHAHLAAIVFGKIDNQGMSQPSQPQFVLPSTSAQPMTTNTNYNFCKTLWNLEQAGKYLGRVATFGGAPSYQKQDVLEFEFEASGPNLYVVQMKIDRDTVSEAQLVELWREGKLVERRILSASPYTASTLAARLPLEPPVKPKSDDDEEDEVARPGRLGAEALPPSIGPGAFVSGFGSSPDQVFPGKPVAVEAAPLFGGKSKGLPPVERVAVEELAARVPSAEQGKVPAALVEVVRLEMGNPIMTSDALNRLREMLGDDAIPLFIRLSEASAPPAALAAIDALHAAGEKSADACRKLIDLQKGPADIQKAAEEAVNDLMTQGVIAQESDNWRYHNQTHFPEKPKEEKKPETLQPSE